MNDMKRLSSRWLGLCLLAPLGCSSSVEIDVSLVSPCNQDVISMMDFLRFTPRGDGLDSLAYETIEGVDSGSVRPISIPLVSNFSLGVTGHRGSHDAPASAIGASAPRDLSNARSAVTIKVPLAMVDSFYRTTDLAKAEPTCTKLGVDRFGATATYMPENGRVLILGGARLVPVPGSDFPDVEYPRAVELFDPATGTFEVIAELAVGGARAFHTATRLTDGRILIAGGQIRARGMDSDMALQSALLVDARDLTQPVRITTRGAMVEPRTGHKAVRLSDGRVALIGGRVLTPNASTPRDHEYLRSIELFDPEQGIFTRPNDELGNRVEMSAGRFGHTATLLRTGFDILVAGGMDRDGPVLDLEVINISGQQGRITISSEATNVGPIYHAAELAQDGSVLLSGGYGTVADAEPPGSLPTNPSREVEMWSFNDATGQLTRACSASLALGRGGHTVTMVGRRAVFIGGRGDDGTPLADAEVATLARGASCFFAPPETRPMSQARAQHAVTVLEGSGEIMVVGGRQQQNAADLFGMSSDRVEIFSPARDL